jgi:uncharacterized protein YgiM (DUF1202 family)
MERIMIAKYKLAACLAALGSAFLLFSGCGDAADFGKENIRQGGVVTENNTALRISPLVFSGIVTRLEKGYPFEVIERSAEKSKIARTTDFWYHIKLENGITGWIYGQNLRLMNIKNRKQLDSVVSEFKEQESGAFAKALSGKWWSINAFGDFTNHALELYEDNKYKSYFKGQEKYPIQGEFSVDFSKSDIIFPRGTSFKANLKFAQRGSSYILYTSSGDTEMSFKKIQEGMEEEEKKDANIPADGDPAQQK